MSNSMPSIVARYLTEDNVPLLSKRAYGEGKHCRTVSKYIASAAKMLSQLSGISLYYFMRENQSKTWAKPTHTAKIAAQLDNVIQNPKDNKVELCLSMPPQHGKTELIIHFIAMYCLKNPTKSVAYASYSFTRSKKVTRKIKQLFEKYNLEFEQGAKTQDCFVFKAGGQLITTSIDGSLTGEPVDLLVIDDPIKGQKEARSPIAHVNALDWFEQVANTRKHENTSTVVISTRWNQSDLIGGISRQFKDYEIINMPALCDDPENDYLGRELDEPLFPAAKSKKFLMKVRAETSKSVWQTMYQGKPTPKEDRLFNLLKTQYYSELPKNLAILNGVDLAYTTKSSSDFTAFVTLAKDTKTNDIYIINIERFKAVPAEANPRIAELNKQYPYTIVIERNAQIGAVDYLDSILKQNNLPKLHSILVSGDKYTRALGFAGAWNTGKVFLPNVEQFPSAQAWIPDFLEEIGNFTGIIDRHDDMIDASTNAFNILQQTKKRAGVYEL